MTAYHTTANVAHVMTYCGESKWRSVCGGIKAINPASYIYWLEFTDAHGGNKPFKPWCKRCKRRVSKMWLDTRQDGPDA